MQSPRRLLNYSLLREIGRGGMATVWYAENSVGRKFAVKILKPELVAEELSVAERFRNEAQIMVRLEHPAILRVEDFYEEGTTLAIIMEYLAGHDLNQHIRLHGQLPEAKVVAWFTRILDAFAYVHQKGYFHRDVKPSNLFLTDSGLIKVMDFGIAKIVGADLSLTQTDMLMGSPLYMSPEQITSPKSVDFRTDIYSLGVTLHALLAGKKPYDDVETSMFHIQTAIVHEPLPRLAHVSDTLNDVIQRATQKKASDRFADCAEFAQALIAQIPISDDATVLKSQTPRRNVAASDDATVVRSKAPKVTDEILTEETVLRSQPGPRAKTITNSPATSPPKPSIPLPITAEIPVATPAKNRMPLIAASIVGFLVLGIGGWLIWSKQSAGSQTPVTLVVNSLPAKTEATTKLSQTGDDLNRAISFYNNGQYDSALVLFDRYKDSATFAENDEAMTDLGIIHYFGDGPKGIPQNLTLANEWLQKGVNKQNPKAYYYFGLLKDGVDFSSPEKAKAQGRNRDAVNLYKQAAELGEPYAQLTLGELFLMENQYVVNMDACQVLDYVKQATDKKISESLPIYTKLKNSGKCTR
ncbi:hypothetical protein GCM10027592_45710 [Spirosoma flavus]